MSDDEYQAMDNFFNFDYAPSVASANWDQMSMMSQFGLISDINQDIAETVINAGIIASKNSASKPMITDGNETEMRQLTDTILMLQLDNTHRYMLKLGITDGNETPSWAKQKWDYQFQNRNEAFWNHKDVLWYHEHFGYEIPQGAPIWNEMLGQADKQEIFVDPKKKVLHSPCGCWNNEWKAMAFIVNKGVLRDLALSPFLGYTNNDCTTMLTWTLKTFPDFTSFYDAFRQCPDYYKRSMIIEMMALGGLKLESVASVVNDKVLIHNKCEIMKYEDPATRVISTQMEFMQFTNVSHCLSFLLHL